MREAAAMMQYGDLHRRMLHCDYPTIYSRVWFRADNVLISSIAIELVRQSPHDRDD
jgi:hypothetical protein